MRLVIGLLQIHLLPRVDIFKNTSHTGRSPYPFQLRCFVQVQAPEMVLSPETYSVLSFFVPVKPCAVQFFVALTKLAPQTDLA